MLTSSRCFKLYLIISLTKEKSIICRDKILGKFSCRSVDLSLQDQDDKELNYALVRMVRSLGSSMTFTRRGFYSTLTVFLMMHPDTSVEKLLSIMNTQLHPAGSNPKSVRFLVILFLFCAKYYENNI